MVTSNWRNFKSNSTLPKQLTLLPSSMQNRLKPLIRARHLSLLGPRVPWILSSLCWETKDKATPSPSSLLKKRQKTWEHELTSVEKTSFTWARTRLEDPDDCPSSIKTTKTAGSQSGNFKLAECKKQPNVAGAINSADVTMFIAASTSKAAAAHDVKSVKPCPNKGERESIVHMDDCPSSSATAIEKCPPQTNSSRRGKFPYGSLIDLSVRLLKILW